MARNFLKHAGLLGLVAGLLALSFWVQAESPARKPAVVRSLADRWLVYDGDKDAYIPASSWLGTLPTSQSMWLDTYKDRYPLRLETSPDLCLYFDRKLYYHYSDARTVYIDLPRILKESGRRKVFFTLYQPDGKINTQKVELVSFRVSEAEAAVAQPVVSRFTLVPLFRNESLFSGWVLVYVLGIVALFVAIRVFSPRPFAQLFALGDVVSTELSSYSQASRKSFSPSNVGLIVANSAAISLMGWAAAELSRRPDEVNALMAGIRLQALAEAPVLISYLILGLLYFVGKYVLVNFAGTMFGMNRVTTAHFYEFIRFSTLLSVALLVWMMLVFLGHYIPVSAYATGFSALALLSIFARIAKITGLLSRQADYRNLYLFSYLCSTEIIPLAVIAKVLTA